MTTFASDIKMYSQSFQWLRGYKGPVSISQKYICFQIWLQASSTTIILHTWTALKPLDRNSTTCTLPTRLLLSLTTATQLCWPGKAITPICLASILALAYVRGGSCFYKTWDKNDWNHLQWGQLSASSDSNWWSCYYKLESYGVSADLLELAWRLFVQSQRRTLRGTGPARNRSNLSSLNHWIVLWSAYPYKKVNQVDHMVVHNSPFEN